MIVDALISAQPYMKIAERVEIPERYIRLNDSIMNRVLETEQPVRHEFYLDKHYHSLLPGQGIGDGTLDFAEDRST
jgi:hypothetical protein